MHSRIPFRLAIPFADTPGKRSISLRPKRSRMQPIRLTAARGLIWLAILMLPVQTLPAAPCGCMATRGSSSEERERACSCSVEQQDQGRCCCSKRQSRRSCCCSGTTTSTAPESADESAAAHPRCECGADCQCGANCPCGQRDAPTPTLPPTTAPSDEVVQVAQTCAAPTGTLLLPTRHVFDQPGAPCIVCALCRCVLLCRFLL